MFPSKLIVYWILIIIFSTQSQTHTFLSRRQELFYNNFKQANGSNNLTLSGIAQIDSNGCLQLTNGTRRAIGHAFYSSPFRLKRSPSGPALSFSTMFAFAIVPHAESYGGHGMAFSMVPDKELKGVFPGQYLGLLNPEDDGNLTNHVFAIEFDTVMDYESRDVNDNHVGIDINSMKSKASVAAGYYVDGNSEYQNLSLRSGKTILSWVDYDSAETQIDVRLSFTSQKPNRSVLSFKADLSHCLDEFMFVGFSASTGMIASSHYVMGWSFHVSGVALPLDLTSLARLPTPKGSKARAVVVGASLGSALGIIIALLGVWRYKNKDVVEPWELHVGPHRFPYRELRKATKGFSDKEVIGFGGFGKVYRGILPKTREEVAVKRISHDSKQGLQEFLAEIASIGHLRHRNLVQLLGWGRRLGDLLLVYEFMPNGSLDKYLFGEPMMVLSWELRFTIIKGVARGLVYLHEGWEQTVIHRDVKAANVLLDGEFNGRLTDFGLAKLYERGSNPTTTRVVGTMGYLAPELTKTCKPTTFSDVYAFGAFLLEVACGRRPVEPKALPEELILVDFVWDKWKGGAILDVMDAKLKGVYDEVEAVMVLKLGLICSADKPVCRPSMKQVLQYLEGEVPMPEVVLAPGGYDGKQGGVGSSVFEDYELSYSSPPQASSYLRGQVAMARSDDDVEDASNFSFCTAGSHGR